MTTQSFQLEETTIQEIQQAFQEKRLTSAQLVQLYLNRIEQFDRNGPKLNAVLSLNPDALEIAAERDAERGTKTFGPLHGIPVLLKDNIETKDRMATTAGAVALESNFAVEDAFIAGKLREAGAIILGKANMSEWAYFMTQNVPSGFSNLGGQVRHPYGADRFEEGSVGGSSSGTGVAIAANFAVLGVGTETSGSILSPASANSIVGIKPTVGLLSRSGIIPLAESQDTAGPMARTVTDAAIALGILAGVDEQDPITETARELALKDYTDYLKPDGLQNARIGVDMSFLSPVDSEERALILQALEDLILQGATIVEIEIPQTTFESEVLWYEFKRGVDAYLGKLPEEVAVKSLSDVIEFNKQDPDTRMKFGQLELEKALTMSGDPHDPVYVEHRITDIRISSVEGIDRAMSENRLDALLFENNRGAAMPAKAGYPSITVPAGYTSSGMPVGVTFSTLAYQEARLIELAFAYEQATQRRVAPRFTV
jgi:amidase